MAAPAPRRPRRSSILKRQSIGPGGDGGSGDINVGFVDGKVVGVGTGEATAFDMAARISRRVSFSQTNEIKEYEKSNSSAEGSLLKPSNEFNQTMCDVYDMSLCEDGTGSSEEVSRVSPNNVNLGQTIYKTSEMSVYMEMDHTVEVGGRRKSSSHNATSYTPRSMDMDASMWISPDDDNEKESVPLGLSVYQPREMSMVNDQENHYGRGSIVLGSTMYQQGDMSMVIEKDQDDRAKQSAPHGETIYQPREMSMINAPDHGKDAAFQNATLYQPGDMSMVNPQERRGRKSVTLAHGTTLYHPGEMSMVGDHDQENYFESFPPNRTVCQPGNMSMVTVHDERVKDSTVHGLTIFQPGDMSLVNANAPDNLGQESVFHDGSVYQLGEMSMVKPQDQRRKKSVTHSHSSTIYQATDMSMINVQEKSGGRRKSVPNNRTVCQPRDMSMVDVQNDNEKESSTPPHCATIYQSKDMSMVKPQEHRGRKSVTLDVTYYQQKDMSMEDQDDCTKENTPHSATIHQPGDMSLMNVQNDCERESASHGVTIYKAGDMSMVHAQNDREKQSVPHSLTIHQPADMSVMNVREDSCGKETVPHGLFTNQPKTMSLMNPHPQANTSGSNAELSTPQVAFRPTQNINPMRFDKPTPAVYRDPLGNLKHKNSKKAADVPKIDFGVFASAKTPKRNKFQERVPSVPVVTQPQETSKNLQGRGRCEEVQKASFGIQTSPWLNASAKSNTPKKVEEIGLNCTIMDHFSPQPGATKSTATTSEYGTNTSPFIITSVLTTAGKSTHCNTVAGGDISVMLKNACASPIPSVMSFSSNSKMLQGQTTSKENKVSMEQPSIPATAASLEINETVVSEVEQLRETAITEETHLNITFEDNEKGFDVSKSMWANSIAETEQQRKVEDIVLSGSTDCSLTPAPSPIPPCKLAVTNATNRVLGNTDNDTGDLPFVAKAPSPKTDKEVGKEPNLSFRKESKVSEEILSNTVVDSEQQEQAKEEDSVASENERESSIHDVTINQTGDMSIVIAQDQGDRSILVRGADADLTTTTTPRAVERSYVVTAEKVSRCNEEAEVSEKIKDHRASISPIPAVTSCLTRPNVLPELANAKEIAINAVVNSPETPIEKEVKTPTSNEILITPEQNQIPNTPVADELPNTQEADELANTPIQNVVPETPMTILVPETPMEVLAPETPMTNEIPETPTSEASQVSDVEQLENTIIDRTQPNLTLGTGNMEKDGGASQSVLSYSVAEYEDQETRVFASNRTSRTHEVTLSSARSEGVAGCSYQAIERKIETYRRTCDPYDVIAECDFLVSLKDDLTDLSAGDWQKVAKRYEEFLSKTYITAINLARTRPDPY